MAARYAGSALSPASTIETSPGARWTSRKFRTITTSMTGTSCSTLSSRYRLTVGDAAFSRCGAVRGTSAAASSAGRNHGVVAKPGQSPVEGRGLGVEARPAGADDCGLLLVEEVNVGQVRDNDLLNPVVKALPLILVLQGRRPLGERVELGVREAHVVAPAAGREMLAEGVRVGPVAGEVAGDVELLLGLAAEPGRLVELLQPGVYPDLPELLH